MITKDNSTRNKKKSLLHVLQLFPFLDPFSLEESILKKHIDYNPTKFAKYISKLQNEELDLWQIEEFDLYGQVLRGELPNLRRSLPSGHGVGKTWFASVVICYAVLNLPRIAGIATSNTGRQLITKLVRSVQIISSYIPQLKCTTLGIKHLLHPYNTVSFLTFDPNNPDAFQGLHEDFVLIIIDECSKLDDLLFEVLEGALSGGRYYYLLLGNPTTLGTYFHKTSTIYTPPWSVRSISSLESKRVNPEYPKMIESLYGEKSDIYKVRVLGQFPSENYNMSGLFNETDFKNVNTIKEKPSGKYKRYLGMDIGAGGDKTVITDVLVYSEEKVIWIDNVLSTTDPNLVNTSRLPLEYLGENLNENVEINMDSTGVGAGVADLLVDHIRNNDVFKYYVRLNPFNFSSRVKYIYNPYKPDTVRDHLFTNFKKLLTTDWIVVNINQKMIDELYNIKIRDDSVSLEVLKKSNSSQNDFVDSFLLAIMLI
jgi:hypothetical protein